MSSLLDRLARRVAATPGDDDAAGRLDRNALLRRGFAGALALSSLGHLITPPGATAATCPRGSLSKCLAGASSFFKTSVGRGCDSEPSFAAKFECLRESHTVLRDLQKTCRRRCPQPKPKRPPGSKPTRPTPPPPPPPLPPNPYDDGGLCATCVEVGGKCCWGGALRGGFCACANPTIPCPTYGCP